MIVNLALVTLAGIQIVSAFPWVSQHAGLPQTSRLRTRAMPGSAASCPNNPNHTGAAPMNAEYPYCGAKNGMPGNKTCTNNKVPADGDTAHYYTAPGPLDIRGPCPGLNTAANHNFLSHDGVTNFTELIDAQQNMYGVNYDLAVLLAVLGVGFDGDPIGTTKLSLGCDATSRTSLTGLGTELGLDGHDKFEGDSSLTRNDYFLANGDNFSLNKTLYDNMTTTCAGNCNRENIGLFRYQRYNQSLNDNGDFYFGPKSLLLYGAASFLYELFPSGGNLGIADKTTMDYFFLKEQLPPNWSTRVIPYSLQDIGTEIGDMYSLHPVPFGSNTGEPNSFVGLNGTMPYFENGTFSGTTAGAVCALYLLATDNIPAELGGGDVVLPVATLAWAAAQLNPIFSSGVLGGLACPLNFNSA